MEVAARGISVPVCRKLYWNCGHHEEQQCGRRYVGFPHEDNVLPAQRPTCNDSPRFALIIEVGTVKFLLDRSGYTAGDTEEGQKQMMLQCLNRVQATPSHLFNMLLRLAPGYPCFPMIA
jgi:hypothetical protein